MMNPEVKKGTEANSIEGVTNFIKANKEITCHLMQGGIEFCKNKHPDKKNFMDIYFGFGGTLRGLLRGSTSHPIHPRQVLVSIEVQVVPQLTRTNKVCVQMLIVLIHQYHSLA